MRPRWTSLLRRFRPDSPIRGALIGGFTVVFGLWLVSGYDLVRRLEAVERRTAAEHQAALRGERMLSSVRTNVLLSSIYLRDAIIDNRSANASYYRQQLVDMRAEIERLLSHGGGGTSAEEREIWGRLDAELDAFWASRETALSPGERLNAAEARSVLRRRVVPSRNSILQIIDRLSELQVLSERRHEAEVSALYAQLLNRLLLIGALAIAVGLLVAGVATHNVGRLEREIEEQRAGERRVRRELERLSARLVTVQEEERRSLARELHDEVGQALTAIKMDLAVALRASDALRRVPNGPRIATSLEDARAIADTTLHSVRDLSQLLRPSMLDDFGLPEALRAHLRAFSQRTSVQTRLVLHGMDARLPPDVEVCIYRIAQEALTNVARHSGASTVTLTLSLGHGALEMTIEDDGAGVDAERPGAASARGLGIIGMRERAQTLGGAFTIGPRPQGGTRIAVHVPAVSPVAPAAPAAAAPARMAG